MNAKYCKWSIPLLLSALLWMELAQAFCFSFGTGSNSRANSHHRPYHAPGFHAQGYPAYPFGPPVQRWYGPPVFGLPFVPGSYPGGYAPLIQQ